MRKKLIALGLTLVMATGLLTGCGGGESKSEVYFLNFKPEVTDVYKDIADSYEKETGVKVKVVTASSGEYESTLKAELAKTDAPTIFQINGPIGYETWKDYCMDLISTNLYSQLTMPELAVNSGAGVYGIPYAVEGYGIIYNKKITDQYFALPDKKSDCKSMTDVKGFEQLKVIVEDMTEHADELGIEGVFASTSLAAGQQWRWQTHLANVPFYYEFAKKTDYSTPLLAGLASNEIEFTYSDEFCNTFDLYVNNSVTNPKLLSSKSVEDSMSEFALGKCAMVQNGSWAWDQIKDVDGNVVKAKNVKFMPIYTGISGEQNQGICIGTENYFAINSQADSEQQQKSIEFLEWLFTSETGMKYVKDDLGFIAPFKSFEDAEYDNPLVSQTNEWMQNEKVNNLPWVFASFPDTVYKDEFGQALLDYTQENAGWNQVVERVKESWKTEKAK